MEWYHGRSVIRIQYPHGIKAPQPEVVSFGGRMASDWKLELIKLMAITKGQWYQVDASSLGEDTYAILIVAHLDDGAAGFDYELSIRAFDGSDTTSGILLSKTDRSAMLLARVHLGAFDLSIEWPGLGQEPDLTIYALVAFGSQ